MPNMELIETKTAGSGGVSNFDFTSIPQTYTDLLLKISLRGSFAGVADNITLTINNSAIGTPKSLFGNGASAISNADPFIYTGSTATASTFGNGEFYIPNYTSSNNKSISADTVSENNATTAYTFLNAALWSNSAAITSIKLAPQGGGTWSEHSTASLYGISNVTSTTKATGGIVSSDGTYNYHMFPFSGTFTPTEAITADYLVIAGGGGGGASGGDVGGGGGAGGLRSTVGATGGGGSLETALSLSATPYTVTVGAGGFGGNPGSTGSDSVFSTITATGGGGAGGPGANGLTGGSGGGAGGSGATSSSGGARTASPVQGFAGGNNFAQGGVGPAGGGGGAGAVGANAVSNVAGNGGIGAAISAFANATQTGINTYYAGGGGGALVAGSGRTLGIGGLGGGGNSASGSAGVAGVANTGGGGGGAYASTAGNGGSGLVIIRYAI